MSMCRDCARTLHMTNQIKAMQGRGNPTETQVLAWKNLNIQEGKKNKKSLWHTWKNWRDAGKLTKIKHK